MINQDQLQELIDKIIINENIRDMYQEEGKRKNKNYYTGKVEGLYSAMETLGYARNTAIGMILMEREKKLKRKKEQELKTSKKEKKDDQQGKV